MAQIPVPSADHCALAHWYLCRIPPTKCSFPGRHRTGNIFRTTPIKALPGATWLSMITPGTRAPQSSAMEMVMRQLPSPDPRLPMPPVISANHSASATPHKLAISRCASSTTTPTPFTSTALASREISQSILHSIIFRARPSKIPNSRSTTSPPTCS